MSEDIVKKRPPKKRKVGRPKKRGRPKGSGKNQKRRGRPPITKKLCASCRAPIYGRRKVSLDQDGKDKDVLEIAFHEKLVFQQYETHEEERKRLFKKRYPSHQKAKRYRGPRTWLPLDVLVPIIRGMNFKSSRAYRKWYKEFRPNYAPADPYMVYDEFQDMGGWNYYLGNKNTFDLNGKKVESNFVDYYTCIKEVHSKKFSGMRDYQKAVRAGEFTNSVPIMPEAHYKEWAGWPEFLGKSARAIVKLKREQPKVWMILKTDDSYPNNCIDMRLMEKSDITDEMYGRAIRLYVYEKEYEPLWDSVISNMTTEYTGMRLVSDFNALRYELDSQLLIVKIDEHRGTQP